MPQLSIEAQQEDEQAMMAIVALAVLGRPGQRQIQTYLTRADLAFNPRLESAWVNMRAAENDRAFITTMGLDVRTFKNLLSHFASVWDEETIPRADVNPNGEPRSAQRSLDSDGVLGLVLHWLCSTMASYTLQQIFAITPSVCSRYLGGGLQVLLRVLQTLPNARITWPSSEERCQSYSDMITRKYPLLKKCFAFIDGLNLPILVSGDDDVQNAYYNGWTCSHYCSSILTFAPDGTLIHAVLNTPGSWHDSHIAEPLYQKLLNNTPLGYRVISDTAFPRKGARLQGRILAPTKRGEKMPSSDSEFAHKKVLNERLVCARQAAEWGMHSIQGSFARIKLPLPADDHQFRTDVLQIAWIDQANQIALINRSDQIAWITRSNQVA
ncbi:hypothetical protein PGT21_026906 [Puccinia graminis f. sp. tritici]|uniref:DDE Tnp4 domain-containing protein n=1 Tax=Puccinia graminis f. sp. tritici TaxID=56615 RepID=A0A5B0R1U1_PUCGR|nr:hypothetical protein PGT21_026906 [Puccinia graminis f. sp. tritici]